MIYDTIENLPLYAGQIRGLDKLIKFFNENTAEFKAGRTEFEGTEDFCNGAVYFTAPKEEGQFEAHKKYLDVMYMVDGQETIYVKPTSRLSNIVKPYDESIEALIADMDEDCTPVLLTSGQFVILFPQDAHSPNKIAGESMQVKKYIGKLVY